MIKPITIVILISFVLISPVFSFNENKFKGDESDGSRAVPVHLIPLLDEEGNKITPDDEPTMPFSPLKTCGGPDCHNVDVISKGWHFNALEPNIAPGRAGQPWIYVDPKICTQIPLSYRPWPGTYNPKQLGITTWQFTQLFGRHFPGGGPGEIESENPDEMMRFFISGKLEVNCLVCHNAHPGQDQSEYAMQIARQNFRWAAAGASELATVTGSASDMPETFDYKMPEALDNPELRPPKVVYRDNIFDSKNQVLFDITRKIPNERCYFCHSNFDISSENSEKWASDEDVHLAAGLNCIDCHRHGIDHNITRGYEDKDMASTNPLAGALSCRCCHIHDESSNNLEAGRLGAPIADHKGIPPIHFDKLTCTACHSGPWPIGVTVPTKTARAHALGTLNVNKSESALPHIYYPVFARESRESKIGVYKIVWPTFWGQLISEQLEPLPLSVVQEVVPQELNQIKTNTDVLPTIEKEQVIKILQKLSKRTKHEPIFVAGGSIYSLGNENDLKTLYRVFAPYKWPIAHDVRPAAQSLGVNGCGDCHETNSPFVFGLVDIDSPVSLEDKLTKMYVFQKINATYMKLFAFTFVFRPWLKTISIIAAAIIGLVILVYMLKAISFITKFFAEEN